MTKVKVQFNHPKYSDDALCSSISEILNGNILSAMATVKDSGGWISTAYYCFNSSLDFYILTEPTTQHSLNLAKNKSVALGIYDSHQEWDLDKKGLQIFGECERVEGMKLIEATRLYLERFSGLSKWIKHADDFAKGIINSRFYVIRTKSLKLFDEVTFGKENYITLDIVK